MKTCTIRPLAPSDLPAVLSLLQTRNDLGPGGGVRRAALLEWCAFRNPSAGAETTYWIAEDGGTIIAHLGRMPTLFAVNGGLSRGYYIHDLYVHPEYRRRGMGLFLSMSLYQAIEDATGSFCCLIWTSDLNLEMQRRRGYSETSASSYVRLLDPTELLTMKGVGRFPARLVGSAVARASRLLDMAPAGAGARSLSIEPLRRFEAFYDRFYHSIMGTMGICSYKPSLYLNWKLVDRPFSDAIILGARRKGDLRGVVVLAPNRARTYPEGMIVDLVVDPDDTETVTALLAASLRHFRERGMVSVRCCSTSARVIRILRKLLFLRARRPEPVMMANLEASPHQHLIRDMRNWFLSYSESDEVMLRT